MDFVTPLFWIALLQIIGVNIVLSGDNAVVIALAARSLPDKQRRQAVVIGSGAAVLMRIILTVVAVEILRLPYLKLIGAVLLLWIGVQLLAPEGDEEDGHAKKAASGMAAAVRTILLADLVMSLDNVIAVAAAAKGAATAGLTFLFSADHSDGAMRAAEALVKTLPRYRDPVKLHLLNVQPTAHADVGAFVGKKDIADYHHEQGLAALKPVREILDRAGIPYTAHIGVGDLPQVIANYAKQTRSDQIFVGVSAGRRLAAATSGLVDISVTLMR